MFLEILEEEYDTLCENDEYILDFLLESVEEEDIAELTEALELDEEEVALLEQIVKRVNAAGQIRKTLSRKIRSRRASMTTGISKSRLKLRARKSARTKKKNPMIQRKALRKRKKALRKRKQYGLS